MSTKAVALISGGLDSLLAAKVVQEQGIEVLGIAFVMSAASTNVEGTAAFIKESSEEAGIPVRVIDISDEFLKVLASPKHGYGSNVNPCIDCKIYMMQVARKIMEEEGASFMITGEVLGERPMSQNRRSLDVIQKQSEVDDLLLRPLSAKLLDPTKPEIDELVDREKLLNIQGRSRKPQLALAKKYGIKKFTPPGVSCLLTDPQFAAKTKDLMDHNILSLDNVALLKVGRHFRLDDKTKVIVGRNEEENDRLTELQKENDIILRFTEDLAGPDVFLRGEATDENIKKAAAFVISFSKYKNGGEMPIDYWNKDGEVRQVTVFPMSEEEIEKYRI